MNISMISRKLLRGEWHYVLGRFQTVRSIYSLIQWVKERNSRLFLSSWRPIQPNDGATISIFPAINIQKSLSSLRQEAVAYGFDLPENLVNELREYARSTPCIRSGDSKPFTLAEVAAGKLADEKPVVLGIVIDSMKHPAVKKICSDPILLHIVTKYLGYFPKKINPRLFWSFVNGALSDDYRLKNWQTVKYHFDVDGYNFIYANFYLSNVDTKSGAHVMIKGSHKNKPLKMLFHSANQLDNAVLDHFGHQNEVTIKGRAGFGFLQDSSCYHKALAPLENDRLMLQIRFN